ncbi:MAG: RidA family protein [Actinomycetes bacterium]|jgi:2-iminobutanoate/2-iminopropanoate deaminase
MTKVETFNPQSLGPAIMPYSNAAVANGFLFVAGQVALDPEANVVSPNDSYAQTKCIIDRIKVILAEKGATLDNIAQTTVFITDLKYLPDYNRAWTEEFPNHRPARATVVCGLLIEGLVVEVTAIAAL